MSEAMRDISRWPEAPALAGVRAQAVNGGALRRTPGPDELRLPSCEEEPVSQNSRQLAVITEGVGSLRLHWRGQQDIYVGGDQFVYWDRERPPAAPDVFVAFGVSNRHRSSYVAWEEGKPPDFVLEVVSPSSRQQDEKVKPALYAKMGVPEYFWYDPLGKLNPPLAGFALRRGRYEPLPDQMLPTGEIGVRSTMLGLSLCIKSTGSEPLDVALCWFDPAAGRFLPARHEWADDNRRLIEENRQAAAKVAELEALIEKMQRSSSPPG